MNKSVIFSMLIFFAMPLVAKGNEPVIQQVGVCTAVATKVDLEKPAQVTTTCPGGQVTINFPDGRVKIIQSSGQTIDIDPSN